jgi:hypothetical protein
MTDTITCPTCGTEIVVSETLTAQIRQHLCQQFEQEARRKDQEVAHRLDDLRRQEQQLEAARQSLAQEVSARIVQEQARLAEEARVKAHDAVALEINDLQGQLTEAQGKVDEARKAELQLRKDRRELEERQHELELTVTRTLDEERAKIREAARQQADEDNRLREADRDKLVADLRAQIDELKRRSEKGSPQARGEVMELELEDLLRSAFPHDTIEAVPVGAHGGDVLQRVHDPSGLDCGSILWESKRTKNWSDAWLPKLRNDQRAAKAHLAVLTSEELPKGITTFGWMDSVWVTSRHCLLGLAVALRQGMIEAARTRQSLQGRQNKVELLYNYLAGSEFRQRIEGIVEAFMTLKDDLESEKRSMHRLWAKREKQLERAAVNTSAMYGDLAGILGPSLPRIANLEPAGSVSEAENLELEPVTACAPPELEKAPWE